jgi:hypothetical protein
MPLYRLIEAHVLAAERLHGDDTTVPILELATRPPGHPWPPFYSQVAHCYALVKTSTRGSPKACQRPSLAVRYTAVFESSRCVWRSVTFVVTAVALPPLAVSSRANDSIRS